MSNIERVQGRSAVPRASSELMTRAERRAAARLEGALSAVEHRTLVRMATVQGEGFVTAEKLHEVDRLAHTAMSGQAFLVGWANHLAGNDPLMRDELRFFSDQAKLGKAEVIADAIDIFRGQ